MAARLDDLRRRLGSRVCVLLLFRDEGGGLMMALLDSMNLGVILAGLVIILTLWNLQEPPQNKP